MTAVLLDQNSRSAEATARTYLWAAALVALIVLAYWPVFGAGWLWQDDANVLLNPLLSARGEFAKIWRFPFAGLQFGPLSYSLIWVEHRFFAESAGGFHAVNLILHVANVLLVLTLMKRLIVPGAWLAAAIFALHPVQVEAVAWVSHVSVLLSALFYLTAMLGYLRLCEVIPPVEEYEDRALRFGLPQRPILRHAMVLLLVAASIASHPLGVTFPIAVALIIWWKRRAVTLDDLLQLSPLILLAIGAAVVIVWSNLASHLPSELGGQALLAASNVWFLAVKLIVPIPVVVNFAHSIKAIGPLGETILITLLIVATAAAVMFRTPRAMIVVSAALGYVFISVLSGLLARPATGRGPVDDVQYLACIAPIALAVAALTRTREMPGNPTTARIGISACIALLLGTSTFFVSRRYVDEPTFWNNAVADDVVEGFAHYRLGTLAMRERRPHDGVREFRMATWTDPPDPDAFIALARSLEIISRFDDSASVYSEALRLMPIDVQVLMALAAFQTRIGDQAGAIEHYAEAVKLQPGNAVAHHNLATALARAGRPDEAKTEYDQALKLMPNSAQIHLSLANFLFTQGAYKDAAAHLQRATEIDPMNYDAFMASGTILANSKNFDNSERMFRAAQFIRPDSIEALLNLAAVIKAQGRDAEAVYYLHKAQEISSKQGPAPATRPDSSNIDQLWKLDGAE